MSWGAGKALVIGLAALGVSGCCHWPLQSTGQGNCKDPDKTMNHTAFVWQDRDWELHSLGGQPVDAPEPRPSLHFHRDGQLSGGTGCNRLMAGYRLVDAALVIDPLGATKRLCRGRMELENAFLSALARAAAWDHADGDLVLRDAQGEALMRLTAP